MKTKLLLIASLASYCSFAQTYQNTTATATVDALNRLGECGANVQPGVHLSKINVPIAGTIADPTKITLNLSLNATWLGDVAADIISPTGEAITLIRRIGTTGSVNSCGDSSNFLPSNILSFNSANSLVIDAASFTDTQNIPAGNYAPTIGVAQYPTHNPVSMSTFLNGKAIAGDWTLVIYDYGVGDPSNIASWQIIVSSGALLQNNEAGVFTSEIQVKQNPVKENLMLKISNNDFRSLVLEVYDNSGKLIKKENIPNQAEDFQMNVSSWARGTYMLVPIKDGERKQAIKLLKN